ncbi:MAG TPA: DUF433 domain-containing protein [Thermoanaerobaculia bacterium]|nr:DUF433 domain-containing protein [Thermoanaerobaculia bacterium]
MAEPLAQDPLPLALDRDGVIRVGGTRVPLDTVVAAFESGSTPEQIAEDFSSLAVADVYATISYFLRHRDEVTAYLERRQREAAAVRLEIEAHRPSQRLRERLESRLR